MVRVAFRLAGLDLVKLDGFVRIWIPLQAKIEIAGASVNADLTFFMVKHYLRYALSYIRNGRSATAKLVKADALLLR